MTRMTWDVSKHGCRNAGGELVPGIRTNVGGLDMCTHWLGYWPPLDGELLDRFAYRAEKLLSVRPYTWDMARGLCIEHGVLARVLRDVFRDVSPEAYLALGWPRESPLDTLIRQFLMDAGHWVRYKGRTYNNVEGEYFWQRTRSTDA